MCGLKFHYMLEPLKADSSLHWNNAMDITIDNQQKTDLMYASYLAAMLDGEGSVQLIPWKNRNRIGYQARMSLFNVDKRILSVMSAALIHFGIAHHIYAGGKDQMHPASDVRVCRLKMIKKFLTTVMQVPLLGKRQECNLLLEFVNSRLDENGKPFPGNMKGKGYTKRDAQIAAEIKAIRDSQRAYVEPTRELEDVLWTESRDSEATEMLARA